MEINVDMLIYVTGGLLLTLLVLLPALILILLGSYELNDRLWLFLRLFLCLILPLIVILIGIFVGVGNFGVSILYLQAAWYYIIPITWFVLGIILFNALN